MGPTRKQQPRQLCFREWRGQVADRPAAREQAQGVRSTVAVALSRSPRGLMRLAQTRQWYWIEDDGPSVHWTDDHVSVIDVLNRNILRP